MELKWMEMVWRNFWRGFQYPIEIPSASVDGNSPVALDQMDIDLLNPDAREVMQQ